MILLAGDWHGNTRWARSVIAQAAVSGVTHIEQVGDFGIWPGTSGRVYLKEVDDACRKYKVKLYVTPGNHEDYQQINAVVGTADHHVWLTENIALRPRGERWELEGRSWVSLGGAPSIDFEHRTEGVSWWRAEMITEAEAFGVADAGHADVMLAHDAPDGGTRAVQKILDRPWQGSGWSHRGLRYAKSGRELMDIAVKGVQPKLFVHGHYHLRDDTGPQEPTRYISLNMDGMSGNAVVLHPATLDITWL